jgi:hypothetical protein
LIYVPSAAQAATCTGLPAFASCTAYANGAPVTFGAARYTTIAAIPNNRDCPPNSPYNPATDKGAGSSTDIGHAVGLGSTLSYRVAFSGPTLTVTINGATACTRTPTSSGSSGTFYFKAGNYDQSATSGPVSTTPYSIVEFSALSVSH